MLRGIPGPTPSPIFGLEFLFRKKIFAEINVERRKEFGNVYGTWLGSIPLLMINDADVVKSVMVRDAHNFTDTNPFKKIRIRYLSSSFILKKGKEWKDGRNLVSPVFTTRKIKEIFEQFQKASKPLFSNIEDLIEEGKGDEIDVKDLLKNYQLDVIAKV